MSLALQETEKYRQGSAHRKNTLSSLKERSREERSQAKEFRLNDFQQRLDRYSASKTGL